MTKAVHKKKTKVFEAIARYALAKYGDEFDIASPDCPYETRMGGDRAFIQEVSWFVYEWKNPKTGSTILEEFVAKKMSDKSNTSAKLLLRKNITYGEFEVLANDDDDGGRVMTVRHAETQKEYTVITPRPKKRYATGAKFVGRIHPRDENTYAACGILTAPGEWDKGDEEAKARAAGISQKSIETASTIMNHQSSSRSGPGRDGSDLLGVAMQFEETAKQIRGILNPDSSDPIIMPNPDIQKGLERYKRETRAFETAMSTTITTYSSLRAVLRGYPKELLKIMCNELGIGSLPSAGAMVERLSDRIPGMVCESLYGMSMKEQYVMARAICSGAMPYPERTSELLVADYTGDQSDEYDYDGVEPDSFIQIYTYYGLLVIGTKMIDGKMQKMVAVASDIKEIILKCPGWREFVESGGRADTVDSKFKS